MLETDIRLTPLIGANVSLGLFYDDGPITTLAKKCPQALTFWFWEKGLRFGFLAKTQPFHHYCCYGTTTSYLSIHEKKQMILGMWFLHFFHSFPFSAPSHPMQQLFLHTFWCRKVSWVEVRPIKLYMGKGQQGVRIIKAWRHPQNRPPLHPPDWNPRLAF